MTAVLVSDVSNGALSLSANGSFVYTPGAGFTGTDTFSYRASDGRDDSDVATVTLQVNSATNQVPLALVDLYNVMYETELVVDAISGVLANDTDADTDDVLIAILDTDVSNGTLALNEDGSFTYSPAAGFGGIDSFTYHATDGVNDSAVVQVELDVCLLYTSPSPRD